MFFPEEWCGIAIVPSESSNIPTFLVLVRRFRSLCAFQKEIQDLNMMETVTEQLSKSPGSGDLVHQLLIHDKCYYRWPGTPCFSQITCYKHS